MAGGLKTDRVIGDLVNPEIGSVTQLLDALRTELLQKTEPSDSQRTSVDTAFGKTITFVSVAQGSPGTTTLASASSGNLHKLMGAVLVLDAAGTLSFTDGTDTLMGAVSLAANAGFVLPTSAMPYTQTKAVNRPLNLVTTAGKAAGMVAILTEP